MSSRKSIIYILLHPRLLFKLPRIVPDQREKFDSEDIFKKHSRESEVSSLFLSCFSFLIFLLNIFPLFSLLFGPCLLFECLFVCPSVSGCRGLSVELHNKVCFSNTSSGSLVKWHKFLLVNIRVTKIKNWKLHWKKQKLFRNFHPNLTLRFFILIFF